MAVSREARALDATGMWLIAIGAFCFVIAHIGLSRLHAAGVVLVAKGQSFGAVREWERWTWLWWGGLGLVAIGVGVAVWASILHKREKGMEKGDRLSQPGNG
jgi:hypothetical protein